MRMFILSAFVLSAAVAGCDDGPTQVFTPAPAGAGQLWNDGMNPGFTVDAGQSYTNVSGGNNLQQICTGAQEAARWAVMDMQPIIPPTQAAGIDISGGPTWVGLTIEQAEQINCQSLNEGDVFGDGESDNQWGDNGEVLVEYSLTTRKIDQITVTPGYTGTMNFTSEDGMHHYVVSVNNMPTTLDGVLLPLDWVDASGQPTFDAMYRGMLHTYAPGLPQDPAGSTCFDTGHCILGTFGNIAYFYLPDLGVALWVANIDQPEPETSIINRIDIDGAKVLPYAFAGTQLQLSTTGPTGSAGTLGIRTTPCVMQFGLSFSDFLNNCVEVTGMATADMTEYNKLIGGISHDTETWTFNTQGVDLNFADRSLGTMDIVTDGTVPASTDTAVEFDVDQSTLGPILNDRLGGSATGAVDLHGTGALLREYARLVRLNLLADANIPDGDIRNCLYPTDWNSQPGDGGTAFDAQAFQASLPPYCTGFEGIVIPQNPASPTSTRPFDVNGVCESNAVQIVPSMVIGLKPGHQPVAFCWDAFGATVDPTTHMCSLNNSPNAFTQCNSGDTFSTSYAQVLQVFGHGVVSNLPTDAQDVRFYFKQWGVAFLKMLENPNTTDLSTVPDINHDDLFFDSVGAGQFETMEYVDRRFASSTVPPTDVQLNADVKDGIFNDYQFTRYLYRGESAIYDSIRVHTTDGIGQEENALLTNVFGSPVLAAAYTAGTGTHSAYYCASSSDMPQITAANCPGQPPPPTNPDGTLVMNENGVTLLAPYPGAFGTTVFELGPTAITVTQTFADTLEAEINVPLFANPYDTTSTPRSPLNVMVPWSPPEPNIGFPIALNGDLDRFIETSELDLTGNTLTAVIDYTPQIDPTTLMPMSNGAIQFDAAESTDFLGELFLCQDPVTLDILPVRMYDSVSLILDWFQDHPGATDACQIIIRTSPFNNYVDYITSLSSGVRLGITQGGGFGRVVDGTLFVPGQ